MLNLINTEKEGSTLDDKGQHRKWEEKSSQTELKEATGKMKKYEELSEVKIKVRKGLTNACSEVKNYDYPVNSGHCHLFVYSGYIEH